MNDVQLMTGLTYCGISDGDLCAICPYNSIAGGNCKKVLTREAVNRIKELLEEQGKQSERIYHLEHELKKGTKDVGFKSDREYYQL